VDDLIDRLRDGDMRVIRVESYKDELTASSSSSVMSSVEELPTITREEVKTPEQPAETVSEIKEESSIPESKSDDPTSNMMQEPIQTPTVSVQEDPKPESKQDSSTTSV
jgi:hypothetical protein